MRPALALVGAEKEIWATFGKDEGNDNCDMSLRARLETMSGPQRYELASFIHSGTVIDSKGAG